MGQKERLAYKLVCLLSCIGVVAGISACSQPEQPTQQASPAPTIDTEIRWTSFGIPHVKAKDWRSLGYGFAYATARDAVCVIAKDVVMVNGDMAQHFGADYAASDVFHRAILTDEKLIAYTNAQSDKASEFNAGYVAGYNRFLKDEAAKLPESCRGQAWVKPVTEADITRLNIGVGIRYGLGRFIKDIAQAAPDQQTLTTNTIYDWPAGIGSNAVAVGRELSEHGTGILLGNPHYPWHGSSRFHMIHTTIPGELDVMGSSLLTTTRVAIGFNKDIAWTHTVSTALRFTLYELTLNPDNPMQYLYDGAYRPIEARQVTWTETGDDGKTIEHSSPVYFTHFGPVLENEALPWGNGKAYAIRDAVIDNYLTAQTYDQLTVATSTADVEAAISQQGVYWTNTIAADRAGNAFYADISGTPNVDQDLLSACRINMDGALARAVVLNGSTSNCAWKEDPDSSVRGALAAESMPRLTRADYVTNSNDSYWLSNPSEPLEGFSPIIGSERTARSLRTRAGLHFMQELIDRDQKISAQDLQDMLYSHRNYGAELLLDDLLTLCEGQNEIKPSCDVLAEWDRTMQVDSRGSHIWREFWDVARKLDDLYAVPFDVEDPINTPRGLNVDNPDVAAALIDALTQAQLKIQQAKIPLNATLGEIQYAQRGDRKIPVPGGEGWAGMFSMIVSQLQDGQGYNPIVHGNSYIQAITWDDQGAVIPRAMLTYSQSPEADSNHYADLTELYAQGEWIRLPFTDTEIDADPNLQTLKLVE